MTFFPTFSCVQHAFLDHLRTPGQPLPARGSPPAPHVPPNTRPVVTSRLSPSAAGDGVAGAAARFTPRLLGASIPHISPDRGAPLERAGARQRPRWWRVRSPGARRRSAEWRPWRERRATPRGFSQSPLAHGRAREGCRSSEGCRSGTSSTSFHNFYLGMHYR